MSQLIWSAESLFPFLMWVSSSRKKSAFSGPRRPLAAILILVDLGFLEEIERHAHIV